MGRASFCEASSVFDNSQRQSAEVNEAVGADFFPSADSSSTFTLATETANEVSTSYTLVSTERDTTTESDTDTYGADSDTSTITAADVYVTRSGGNQNTGGFSQTVCSAVNDTVTETGTATATFSIGQNDGYGSVVHESGNAVTGSDTTTVTGSGTTTLTETGSNSIGSYTLTQTVNSSDGETTTANDIAGAYSMTETGASTSTTTEDSTNSGGYALYGGRYGHDAHRHLGHVGQRRFHL